MSTDCPSSTRFAVPYLKPIPNLKKVRVAVQPLLFGTEPGSPVTLQPDHQGPRWTAMAWPQDTDPLVEYLAPAKIYTAGDFVQFKMQNFSAFAVSTVPSAYQMSVLAEFGKPVVPFWDAAGHPSAGPELRAAAERHGVPGFCPNGVEEVERVQRALRAITFMRSMRVLPVGPVWQRSTRPDDAELSRFSPTEYEDMQRIFGMQFLEEREINEFFEAIEQADENEVQQVVQQWREETEFAEPNISKGLILYARVYLALRDLLAVHGSNCLLHMCDEPVKGDRCTCMGLDFWAPVPVEIGRTVWGCEFVPCWAYALLVDEGIPLCCKGATKSLVAVSLLMGLSGGAAIVEGGISTPQEDLLVQMPDLIPPSMLDSRKPVQLADMHHRGVGCTNFGELEEGRLVTGLLVDASKREWYTCTGEVLWTKREQGRYPGEGNPGAEGFALRVKNAPRIRACHRTTGSHLVVALGDWTKHLEVLAPAFQAHVHNLDEA